MDSIQRIKAAILSAKDENAIDKIICDNFKFDSYEEKIAFLKGMFGCDFIWYIPNNRDKDTYFSILSSIVSSRARKSKPVNTTVTLPVWLKELAIEADLNFSHLLQEALKEKLGI